MNGVKKRAESISTYLNGGSPELDYSLATVSFLSFRALFQEPAHRRARNCSSIWISYEILSISRDDAAHALTGTFRIYPAKRLQGRQLLNIVKRLDPTLWCHLFRDSLGADIVKKYKGDVVSVYEVQRILDIERTSTAFWYLRRYAEQKIGRPLE